MESITITFDKETANVLINLINNNNEINRSLELIKSDIQCKLIPMEHIVKKGFNESEAISIAKNMSKEFGESYILLEKVKKILLYL